VIATPIFGQFLNLGWEATGVVTLTLLIGTPGLTLIGTIGAAFMVALRRGGMLVAVLILPFTIPILIFGVSASSTVILQTEGFTQPFLFLCALTLFSFVIAPIAGALAIRGGQD
jgi:heme exporter protein B